MKIISLATFIIFAACVNGDDSIKDNRQKRLLFYDEEGNLVKTYSHPYPNNPYLQNLRLHVGPLPSYGSFLNPFFGFIKDFGNMFAFTIPVSNEVLQQIQKDPGYNNKFILTHTKDPIIEPNPLCEGKRSQIPSPNLCNNYLNCWDGWAVEQECPTGLLFSNQGYCDYSDNVNCESRKLKVQPPTQPQCNKDFEAFRSALTCNEFFVCVGRQPVKFKCPADLAYNQLLGVCDYPSRVDCSSTAINTAVFASQPAAPAPSEPKAPCALNESSSPISPSAPVVPQGSIASSTPNAPSVRISQSTLNDLSAPIAPSSSIIPTAPSAIFSHPALPIISTAPMSSLKPDEVTTVFSKNSVVNSQSWTSTHVAISHQDAVRQLQRGNVVKV